ncbi:MAG: hypothetical protein IPK74_34645, partial [Deltaproteobacteria bacterium]|nr:hypothetical protein [Deltaproteobacteria bacterium]
HMRDMVRQSALDYMQLIRIIRSWDGKRKWMLDLDGDGKAEEVDVDGDGVTDIAGDFDGDGIVDFGSGVADLRDGWVARRHHGDHPRRPRSPRSTR